jgi:hypothetical protein
MDLLKTEVLRRCASVPAEEPAAIEGFQYHLDIAPRENQKTLVSTAKIHKALGLKAFLAVCKLTLKGLEEGLKLVGKEDQMAKFYTEARTGPRTVTAVWRGQTSAAA